MISATILEVFNLQIDLSMKFVLNHNVSCDMCCVVRKLGYLIFPSIKSHHSWKHMVKKHRYLWFIYALHSLHGNLNC